VVNAKCRKKVNVFISKLCIDNSSKGRIILFMCEGGYFFKAAAYIAYQVLGRVKAVFNKGMSIYNAKGKVAVRLFRAKGKAENQGY
jgi:hypothetical protein